jgi:hypothetical protein
MTDTFLALADALLRQCPKDPHAPHYTEAGFSIKMFRARKRERQLKKWTDQNGHDYLAQAEWRGLIQSARLTRKQSLIVGHRLLGSTFEDIGCHFGHSRQGAQRIYVQAVKKISTVLHVYPFRGLHDVYRRETSRGRRRGSKGRMVR